MSEIKTDNQGPSTNEEVNPNLAYSQIRTLYELIGRVTDDPSRISRAELERVANGIRKQLLVLNDIRGHYTPQDSTQGKRTDQNAEHALNETIARAHSMLREINEVLKQRDKKLWSLLQNAALTVMLAYELAFPGKIRQSVTDAVHHAQEKIEEGLDTYVPGREFKQETEPLLDNQATDFVRVNLDLVFGPQEYPYARGSVQETKHELLHPEWIDVGEHTLSVQVLLLNLDEAANRMVVTLADPAVSVTYDLDEVDGKLVARLVSVDGADDASDFDMLLKSEQIQALASLAHAARGQGMDLIRLPVVAVARKNSLFGLDDKYVDTNELVQNNDLSGIVLLTEGRYTYVNVIGQLIKGSYGEDWPDSVNEAFNKLADVIVEGGTPEEVRDAGIKLHNSLIRLGSKMDTKYLDLINKLLTMQAPLDTNPTQDSVWGVPVIGPDGTLLNAVTQEVK